MRSLSLLTIALPFIFGITSASAQRAGAAAAGARGGAISVQGWSTGSQTRSSFAPTTILNSPPRGMVLPGPPVHVNPPLPAFRPDVAPRPHVHPHGSFGVVVPPVAPHAHFRAPVLPRHHHPGIVVIDVPYVWPYVVPQVSEGIVITQVAPGVIQQERRQAESPGNELGARAPGQLAPFDPTPHEVVERMLNLAKLKAGDTLYDLGAGDGRVAIAAAKKFGVRAVGYEIDPGLVKLARENAHKQGVENLVEIRQQDFLAADLAAASVVMLYLSHDGNLTLRSKLINELRPGARLISYTFDMGEWQAKIAERYRDGAGNTHMIYLWQIGEPPHFSNVTVPIVQSRTTRGGPQIIDVK